MKFVLKNFRKKTKSTNKERIAIIARRRNEKTSKERRQSIQESQKKTTSKKIEKKTTSNDFKIENLTKAKAEFRFLFLTERRKNTDIETLKRLTIIVTVLAKSYFSTNDIAEIIDELNKAERRVLTQINKIFTKLSKHRKILFLVTDFYFHDKKDSDSNDFDLFFRKLNENL